MLGNAEAIVTIHGGTHRDERRRLQALFRSDPDVRILVATDAAGEGVNLQNANLMVNYDLPWNPNRLEQRFGRIHRIGQTEVCHLWNLVAKETREGDVYHRLLKKLEVEGEALKGRVFDILGEVFEEISLKELLIEAIRYGDQPEVRARLEPAHRERLRPRQPARHPRPQRPGPGDDERRAPVCRQGGDGEGRGPPAPALLRPLLLHEGLRGLGGSIYPREAGRFEITHVPAAIRERDRRITGRNRREHAPVLKRYERVCFTKEAVRPLDRPGAPFAAMLHPGHPLMLAMSDLLLEQHSNLLRQGAVLVDPADDGERAASALPAHPRDPIGDLSRRDRQATRCSPSACSSCVLRRTARPPLPAGRRTSTWSRSRRPIGALLRDLLAAPWIRADQEQRALALAAAILVPEHYQEVAERRIAHVDKTLAAVHDA